MALFYSVFWQLKQTAMKAKFDKAMNALLLEVDESIVEGIRKIGHEYATEVSREAFTDGWTSAWREENEPSIARLSYLDREFKLVDEYYDKWIKEQEEQ